jgi:hypothetical protein
LYNRFFVNFVSPREVKEHQEHKENTTRSSTKRK